MRLLRQVHCLGLLLLAGCYVYVPVGPEPPETGSYVRVALSAEGQTEVIPRLGPDVVLVRGVAVAPDPNGALPIAVQSYLIRAQGERPFNESILRFEHRHIDRLEQRRLSRSRTALFIGGIIATGLLLDRSLRGGGFFSDDEKPGPKDPS